MNKIRFSFLVFFLFLLTLLNSAEVNIIPKPYSIQDREGYFVLNTKTEIQVSDERGEVCARFLNDFLDSHYGLQLPVRIVRKVKKAKGENVIRFVLDGSYESEAYRLDVLEKSITIAGEEAGLFYGLQSLLQIMPVDVRHDIVIPQLLIEDKPRFGYRGAMLDVGRYFFTVDEIHRFLDLMAYYKLNQFHWHLTEDAGWRIEIKKYPLLTEIGAWRRGTESGGSADSFDRLPYGGYYTQGEIREIVRYAQERNINIVPEIDMPGHMLALLAAYPEVSCTGGPFKVLELWGIQKDVLCAGNEKTYEIVEGILEEVVDLFPSEIIHVGGDEAPKDRWKECPKCQAKMKAENLKTESELQSYFIKRVGAYLASKGRKMIGWDEIMEGGLAPNAMVMSWRGEEGGIEAAKLHHEVVMSPTTYMYLDYYQGNPSEEPVNIGGNLPLDKVYSYEPLSIKIPKENQKYVIGVQGNLWMEFIHSVPKLDYMAFPRLLAVSEVGWNEGTKDYSDFRKRLSYNLQWLDQENVNFRIPEPLGLEVKEVTGKEMELKMIPPVKDAKIYYTLDGGDPLLSGALYTDPLTLRFNNTETIEMKYVVRTKRGRVSATRSAVFTVKK